MHTSNILGMKKIFAISIATFLFVFNANAYINRTTAVVDILDKTSGKNHVLNVPVNQDTSYEKLNLLVRTCKQTDPFEAENAFMFIEISQNNRIIFSGWMNKNEPGENPLQNADYDVWLVRCE